MTQPKFRVAIVGGGIGGLICAIALSRASDIEVDVYEAAHQFTEIGAGIAMFPRVWKIMEELGLAEGLAELANDGGPAAWHVRKSDAPEGLSFYDTQGTGGAKTWHRADFLGVVLKYIPPSCKTHLRKRLVSLQEPESSDLPVSLNFGDGTTATCDLLVAADGIRSVVRGSIFRGHAEKAIAEGKEQLAEELLSYVDPIWTGGVAYRALVPREKILERNPQHRVLNKGPLVYIGKNRHSVAYPISQGKLINIVAIYTIPSLEGTHFDGPTVTSVPKHEVLSKFEDFEQEYQELLQCIENPTRWAMHALRPLPTFVSKRVVLLGDAAHAMTPNQGSGAGQAIEDAYVLSAMLTHPDCTRATISDVLGVYDHVRRPLATSVLEGSRKAGLLYDFNVPGFTETEVLQTGSDGQPHPNMDVLRQLGREVDKLQEWIWKRSVEEDRKLALGELEKRLSR
ncbi:salicylate hydroxylase [Heliocybe sulcata]|uniref:Salicylate hydroxylase n=1 Tax=Heliocybe sulcata TaxID=5364 RepID=A0A5C3N0Y8_9AGAM|nr:salicylate hydroxylase [Heliocybe sulcata]